jgi:plastocyanin
LRSKVRLTLAAIVLGAAAVALSCSNNDNPMKPGGGGADVTISIRGMTAPNYSPSPDTVTVGQTVAWKNNDSITHTATANGGAFNTGNVSSGATSAAMTMNTVGSFPYHCSIHPSMTGILVVKAAALATVTISIVGNSGTSSYSPNPVTVSVGQAVKWKNNDGSMTHTATSDDGTTFDTGSLAPGATSGATTMTTAGSFQYHCQFHAGMVGTLVVNP